MNKMPTYEELEQRVKELEQAESELKTSEKALRKSEEKYKTILENIEDGYYEVDVAGNFVFHNDSMCKILGYSKDELTGLNNRRYMEEENAKKVFKVFNRVYKTGQPHKAFDWELIRKDGSMCHVEASVALKRDSKGQPIGFQGIARDITERKQAEEMLHQSENKLRATLDATPFPVAVVDLKDDIIFFWSHSAITLFGHIAPTASEWYQIAYPDPDYRREVVERWKPYLEIARESRQPVNTGEYRVTCSDGSVRICELYATFLPDTLIVTFNDITECKRVEESLRENEEKFRNLFNNAEVGMFRTRIDGSEILDMNEKYLDILGRTRGEIQGSPSVLHWADPSERDGMVRRLELEGRVPNFECRLLNNQGEVRTCLTSLVLYREQGILEGSIADITERKEAEEERDRILRFSPDLICIAGMDGYFKYVNPAWEKLLGYTTKEVLSRPFMDFIHPEDHLKSDAEIAGLSEGKTKIDFENRYICKDGSILYFLWTATLLLDKKQMYCIGRNITERKQAVEKVRASEAHLRTLIRTIPDLVWLKDPEGIYLSCNPRFESFVGAKMNDIIGKTDYDFVDKEMADSFRENDKKAMAKGKPCINEEEVTFADDGHREILETIKTPMYRNNGQLAGVLGIGRNITERVSLQAQLVQAQKMESVGRLAGGVAHDYNNALSVIIGFTELTIDGVDPAGPLRANLEEVLAAATHAKDITRQLLAFARKQTIAPKVLDLNDNVEGMLKMLRHLIGEDIDLAWLPATNLWPVKMDPSQIDQILANLCVNARDAIGGVGKITIGTDTVVFDTDYCSDHVSFVPGGFVRLAVSDNGCGIDKEILNKIFEPFFTTKDVDKGTGLGLAMVYGIVKQNNGFINVYSEPGKGTTIKIYLPRYEGEVVEIHDESTLEIPPGRGETVLLVEDELSVLKLTQKILDNLGYTTLTAGTPGEALRLAEAHASEIHLLVTDVIMPEMNGRELAERMQSLYPGLKYMFMSGYTANAISHRNILDKGVNFIHKPFSKRDLATTVRNALDEERRLI